MASKRGCGDTSACKRRPQVRANNANATHAMAATIACTCQQWPAVCARIPFSPHSRASVRSLSPYSRLHARRSRARRAAASLPLAATFEYALFHALRSAIVRARVSASRRCCACSLIYARRACKDHSAHAPLRSSSTFPSSAPARSDAHERARAVAGLRRAESGGRAGINGCGGSHPAGGVHLRAGAAAAFAAMRSSGFSTRFVSRRKSLSESVTPARWRACALSGHQKLYRPLMASRSARPRARAPVPVRRYQRPAPCALRPPAPAPAPSCGRAAWGMCEGGARARSLARTNARARRDRSGNEPVASVGDTAQFVLTFNVPKPKHQLYGI